MKPQVSFKEESERMYQPWDPSRITIQDWSQVEVELLELSKELSKSVDISLGIDTRIRRLVLQLQELQ